MNLATISTTGTEARAWHAIAADDVVRQLNTNTQTGIDAAEIPSAWRHTVPTGYRKRPGGGRSCASCCSSTTSWSTESKAKQRKVLKPNKERKVSRVLTPFFALAPVR